MLVIMTNSASTLISFISISSSSYSSNPRDHQFPILTKHFFSSISSSPQQSPNAFSHPPLHHHHTPSHSHPITSLPPRWLPRCLLRRPNNRHVLQRKQPRRLHLLRRRPYSCYTSWSHELHGKKSCCDDCVGER
jgi:hypothetical protein